MTDAERVLALLTYLQTKNKRNATNRLVQDYALGNLTTV